MFGKSFCLRVKTTNSCDSLKCTQITRCMHACMNELFVRITPFITWCCSVNFASHFGFCVRFVCAVTSTARPYRNFVILIFISLSIFQCNTHTHAHAAFQRIVIHLSLSGASSPLNLFACVCTCVCVRVCAYVSFALIFGSIGA